MFLKATPRLWLKSFILHLESNDPDAFKKDDDTMTMSESPFW